MKKIITLMLILLVGGGQVKAITIYIANDAMWDKMYLHEWGGITGTSWPGNEQPLRMIINDKWYYRYTISGTGFIANGGNNYQKTGDQTTSSFKDGAYYSNSDNVLTQIPAPSASYTYNISATANETLYNLYLFKGDTKYAGNWPGAFITQENGEYKFTFGSNSDLGEINAIFKGNQNEQTCNLSVTSGDNNYYIASLAESENNGSWGESVKTNSNGYSTYVSTNNLTIPAKIAYYAKDRENGSATAYNVTNPPASTAMLIKGDSNTTYHFATASSSTSLQYNNAFKAGSGSALTSPGNGAYYYILKGQEFWLANGNVVASNKAYLQLSSPATARPLVFSDNEETGINVVATSDDYAEATYNLSGQRVATPTKGLYIVNGRKVIMK